MPYSGRDARAAYDLGDPAKATITKLSKQFGGSMFSGRFRSTKTYGPELGLSACFRQWRADSHCNQLHGYALSFTLTFEATTLDDRNWVMDFGGLKRVKQFLVETFDHKLLVASDDPCCRAIEHLEQARIASVVYLPAVGCEAFAKMVADFVVLWLKAGAADEKGQVNDITISDRVKLVSVECREHGANSSIYFC